MPNAQEKFSGSLVDSDTYRAIEQFLYKESRLLDNREFESWLDLWADDCRYLVPVRRNLTGKPGHNIVTIEDELDTDDGVAFMDDDKGLLFGARYATKDEQSLVGKPTLTQPAFCQQCGGGNHRR